MVDVGRFRTFNGKAYKLKATSRSKRSLKETQRRWGGGRIIALAKSSRDYKGGDRYGLYMPA